MADTRYTDKLSPGARAQVQNLERAGLEQAAQLLERELRRRLGK